LHIEVKPPLQRVEAAGFERVAEKRSIYAADFGAFCALQLEAGFRQNV
jgi:hypothetical protein